jgi:hypothetical protein
VSALGASGTPQLVTGSVVPRNPTGSWVPLGTGEYNATVSLWDGGNPILFSDTTSPPRQLVLEAEWSAPPFFTDVAAATTAEGSTTYSVVRGSGHVLVGPDGQVTPAEPNACSVFLATFAPGGPGASGTPLTVAFAACVDLGGIDLPSREDRLTVGELDADLPGQPLGPPTPGPGGTVDITVYVNGGTTSVGTYEVEATWDPSILGLDLETTDGGFLPPSDPDLGGPSVVDSSLPGRIIGRHSTPSTSYSGIFDIWTLRLRVLESGTTLVTHTTRQLTSSEAVPTIIGPPTPRPAPAASTDAATFP